MNKYWINVYDNSGRIIYGTKHLSKISCKIARWDRLAMEVALIIKATKEPNHVDKWLEGFNYLVKQKIKNLNKDDTT